MIFEHKIDHNSKTKNRKNRKIYFSFDSEYFASSIKMGAKLRGGVYISLVGKNPAVFFSIDLASSGNSQEVECGSILARIPDMR